MQIPQDPNILLSFVNARLRDYYSSLDELCENLDITETTLREKLKAIQYEYDPEQNQFK